MTTGNLLVRHRERNREVLEIIDYIDYEDDTGTSLLPGTQKKLFDLVAHRDALRAQINQRLAGLEARCKIAALDRNAGHAHLLDAVTAIKKHLNVEDGYCASMHFGRGEMLHIYEDKPPTEDPTIPF